MGYCRRRRFASGNKIGAHCESVESAGNLRFDAGYFASLSFPPIMNFSEEAEQTFREGYRKTLQINVK
jgi:predicted SPOUT superfamily RNA methylase MTH1